MGALGMSFPSSASYPFWVFPLRATFAAAVAGADTTGTAAMAPDSPLGDLSATELLAMVLVLAATAAAASAAITLVATAAVTEAPQLLQAGLHTRLTLPEEQGDTETAARTADQVSEATA